MNCEACGGRLIFIGILGDLAWMRCECCGAEQHVEYELIVAGIAQDDYEDEHDRE